MVKILSLLFLSIISSNILSKKRPLYIHPMPEDISFIRVWYKEVFNDSFSKEIYFMYLDKFNYRDTTTDYFRTKANSSSFEYGGAEISYANRRSEEEKFAKYMKKRIIDYHINGILKQNPSFKFLYELQKKIRSLSFLKLDFNYSNKENKTIEVVSATTGKTNTSEYQQDKIRLEKEIIAKIKEPLEPVIKNNMRINSKIDIIKGYININLSSRMLNAAINYDFSNKTMYYSADRPITKDTGISIKYIPKSNEIKTTIGKSLSKRISLTTTYYKKLISGGNASITQGLKMNL